MGKQHWTAEENNTFKTPDDQIHGALSGYVIRYDPHPGGIQHDDGSMSLSLNFPALALTAWVAFPQKIAQQLARNLNTHAELLAALKAICGEWSEHGEGATLSQRIEQGLAAIAAAERPVDLPEETTP